MAVLWQSTLWRRRQHYLLLRILLGKLMQLFFTQLFQCFLMIEHRHLCGDLLLARFLFLRFGRLLSDSFRRAAPSLRDTLMMALLVTRPSRIPMTGLILSSGLAILPLPRVDVFF